MIKIRFKFNLMAFKDEFKVEWNKQLAEMNTFWQKHIKKYDGKIQMLFIPPLCAFLDIFLFFIPTDLVIATAILTDSKKRSYKIYIFSALASTLALTILYFGIHSDLLTETVHQWISKIGFNSEKASELFNKYGVWSIPIISVTPFPVQAPVILSAATQSHWSEVLSLILFGRLLRFGILTFGVKAGWSMFKKLKAK